MHHIDALQVQADTERTWRLRLLFCRLINLALLNVSLRCLEAQRERSHFFYEIRIDISFFTLIFDLIEFFVLTNDIYRSTFCYRLD